MKEDRQELKVYETLFVFIGLGKFLKVWKWKFIIVMIAGWKWEITFKNNYSKMLLKLK